MPCCCSSDSQYFSLHELPGEWDARPHTVHGYRVKQGICGALRSVFSFSHNDTWVLWSDILPLMLFVALAFVHINSVHYHSLPPSAQLLEMGVFVGIIVLRICSLAYHTFQSVSVWTLRRLLGLDQIGISMMTLVDPYFFLVGCHSSAGMLDPHPLDRPDFQLFLTVLLSTQFVTVAILLINMFLASPKQHQTLSQLTEPLLFLLAVIGNWPLLRIIIGSVPAPLILRVITLVAMMSTLCAYVFFFKMHMPEVYFPAGSSDGRWWNSHVLWHCSTAVSHLLFISCVMSNSFLDDHRAWHSFFHHEL